MIPEPFYLSRGDRQTGLWLRLRDHLETKLASLRGRNDGPLNERETATLRGHIECLKGIIALGTEELPPQDG